jgi:hypothetical protein
MGRKFNFTGALPCNCSSRRWEDLGGTILKGPSVLYDPASGNMEIYVVGRNRSVWERAWNHSRGWYA